MKQSTDKFTSELFGNRAGRPSKLYPKTAAERQRDYRARLSVKLKKIEAIIATRDENLCCYCGCERNECCGICNIGQLGHV
jgi:hypothetical protein